MIPQMAGYRTQCDYSAALTSKTVEEMTTCVNIFARNLQILKSYTV